MTSLQLYNNVLVELNKVEAPNILLEDFNYFANKAVNNYINKRYNIYDINQQTTDDIRVLKATAILPVHKKYTTTSDLNDEILDFMGATYEVELPEDYLHILNCVCIYHVLHDPKGCYDRKYQPFPAKRLTADSWSEVLGNYWNQPRYYRPYYYIHNVNESVDIPTNPYRPIPEGDNYNYGKNIQVLGTDYLPSETKVDYVEISKLAEVKIKEISKLKLTIDNSEYIAEKDSGKIKFKLEDTSILPEGGSEYKYELNDGLIYDIVNQQGLSEESYTIEYETRTYYLLEIPDDLTNGIPLYTLIENLLEDTTEELYEESEYVIKDTVVFDNALGKYLDNSEYKFIYEFNKYLPKTADSDIVLYLESDENETSVYKLVNDKVVDLNDVEITDSYRIITSKTNIARPVEFINLDGKPHSIVEREAGHRYGNVSKVLMELRYGADDTDFKLEKVAVDYIKTPQHILLTQTQVDRTTDTSQVLEFPDYVCQEIINELVMIILENISDPRLQSQPVVSLSIANPVQQLAPQSAATRAAQ